MDNCYSVRPIKNLLWYLSAFFFTTFLGWGQNQNTVKVADSIIVNFEAKTISLMPKDIEKGDFYQIQVTNIPLNQYEVRIKNESTTSTVPLDLSTWDVLKKINKNINMPTSDNNSSKETTKDKSTTQSDIATTFTSFPIQMMGDKEKVSISFVPKSTTSTLQTRIVHPFTFPKESNWYWAVGSSFYYAGLRDERFFINLKDSINPIRVDDSTIVIDSSRLYSVGKEKSLGNEIGLASLMYFGYKCSKWFGIHGSLGPGISVNTDEVRSRLLFGLGVSIGNKHNLTINAGMILGNVDVQSNAVELDNFKYTERPTVTITDFAWSWHGSIGYFFRL